MPAIIAFAELEGFEDAPLRTYSDGMRLRLAFGVLAQLAPHALLLTSGPSTNSGSGSVSSRSAMA